MTRDRRHQPVLLRGPSWLFPANWAIDQRGECLKGKKRGTAGRLARLIRNDASRSEVTSLGNRQSPGWEGSGGVRASELDSRRWSGEGKLWGRGTGTHSRAWRALGWEGGRSNRCGGRGGRNSGGCGLWGPCTGGEKKAWADRRLDQVGDKVPGLQAKVQNRTSQMITRALFKQRW
jgi:hypothetical protein